MSGGAEVGLTVLGGFLAATGGLVIWFVQHRQEQREEARRRQRDALLELADSLLPLLVELERWVGARGEGTWVGRSRELPALGTWTFDDESNANRAPDWDTIGDLAHGVERLWWGKLRTRVYERRVRDAWAKISKTAFFLSLKSGADPRTAATNMKQEVEELYETIRRELDAEPEEP